MEQDEIIQQGLGFAQRVLDWANGFLNWEFFLQATWLGLALILALYMAKIGRVQLKRYVEESSLSNRWLIRPVIVIRRAIFPITVILCLGVYAFFAEMIGIRNAFAILMIKLFLAWFLIGVVTSFIRSRKIFRATTTALWIVAAMQILGWWMPAVNFLDQFRYNFGETSISLLGVIKGAIAVGVFLWIARIIGKSAERFIKQLDDLTPSVKVLLSKLVKILLYIFAALMAMRVIGLDLTTLTVFSGAAGLGLGFGLQKVFSNYISGIILLMDRSIKPGDVIAIDQVGTYGWVQSLGSRYVSIITRDGKEHLVPNELLITEKVENWSHSDNNVRIHVPVGVSYESDLEAALTLIEEAVNEEPRVIRPPKPNVLVTAFDDSAITIEARCWIRDPVNGIANVRSSIFRRIWRKFHDNGIAIPYPQQDLHIRSLSVDVLQDIRSILIDGKLAREMTSSQTKSVGIGHFSEDQSDDDKSDEKSAPSDEEEKS